MPVYQYRDLSKTPARKGDPACIVELVRSVADRDLVPAQLERICVPVRVGIGGTSSDPVDPHSADGQVPRAYRQLEDKMDHHEILREGGFTVDQVKEAWRM